MNTPKYKVYLLDDDEDDVAFFKGVLENADCTSEIEVFRSANTLLQNLFFLTASELPDIIIMDHQMPLLDGSSLVKLIRSDKKLHSITLGIYSTEISETKLQDLYLQGLNIFVAKANTLESLKYHVKQFCDAISENKFNGG